MRLPNGDGALVEDSKLREYVLNPHHPVGRHHAVLFERLLGINAGNAGVLKEALAALVVSEPVTCETTTPFGRKYEVRGEVRGPLETKRVVSVWIIDEGGNVPRLVTCYVE